MSRYTPLRDRLPVRWSPLDLPCRRCASPTGQRCRRMRWTAVGIAVVGGRVRHLPPGMRRTEEECTAHAVRRQDARARSARRVQ